MIVETVDLCFAYDRNGPLVVDHLNMRFEPGTMTAVTGFSGRGKSNQRVALCRALLTEPAFLLADELTGNLDRQTASQVVDVMIESARSGAVVVIWVCNSTALRAEVVVASANPPIQSSTHEPRSMPSAWVDFGNELICRVRRNCRKPLLMFYCSSNHGDLQASRLGGGE